MASFNPSPAPRRSSRVRAEPTRSRLTTPLPAAISEDNAPAPAPLQSPDPMDVDLATPIPERPFPRSSGETIFAKSDQLTVTFYADLPVEVSQVLKNADFYNEQYSGSIDTLTGFAVIASIQTCFVWQHAQALKGIPTCYIFACPQDYSYPNPPFHGLFPYGASREPGLVLLSEGGELRFWDSIGIGLAGGEHYSTTNLGLADDERVTNLLRVDAQTYSASTNRGQLFRISLTSASGKHHLASHVFSRPAPALSFSRLIPSIFSGGSSTSVYNLEPGNINAISLGPISALGGREIWALVDSRIQQWDLKAEGWEDVILELDIAETVETAIQATLGDVNKSDLDLELVDFSYVRKADNGMDQCLLLVSYAPTEDTNSMSVDLSNSGARRMYSLVFLSHSSGTFHVDKVQAIPYQSSSSLGAPMHPRVHVLAQGQLVSVQFGNAVALCSRDSDYSDRLELKSSDDRTLGIGVAQRGTTILVLTAAAMMQATIDIPEMLQFDSETGRAELIKSTMMQAILYGSIPNNPLHFSFPPVIDEESLMRGAEQLSQAVLQSKPEVVRSNHDLTAQLAGRKDRLSWLIQFINDNAALEKMSQSSRQRLAMDAEKLYTSHRLWIQHNELLATNPTHSVLNDVVYAYMCEAQEGHHEDFMRAFFRLRVEDIGEVVQKVTEVTLNTAKETGRPVSELLPEANRIVLTVLRSAFDYREYNLGVYGLRLPMLDAWTSSLKIIDVVATLFETSVSAVENPMGGSSAPAHKGEPWSQLPDLASVLFGCFKERLEWLQFAAELNQDDSDRERIKVEQRFNEIRPIVLESLRRNKHEGAAFRLAEDFQDFESLADLCHRDTVYPPEQNPNADRIQVYIDRFKDDFTTALYKWYIQHGEVRTMFASEDHENQYMDRFFQHQPNPSISWLHDLANGRHGAAASTLLLEAEHSLYLESKHFMLSVGKLAHLAQLQEGEVPQDAGLLDAFHDDLDFVSVHEALSAEFKSALEGVRGRQSLDTQINAIVQTKASRVFKDRPAMALVLKNLIREMLQGKVLSTEDAVDVLTLKDNIESVDDFTTALHLVAGAQKMPEGRQDSAFRTVWRRAYIHDDWNSIRTTVNVSDAELSAKFRSTALYVALKAILNVPEAERSGGYETIPNIALIVPTREEIQSRWPGKSAQDIDQLEQDYNWECDVLGELDLEDVYSRVRELAVEDFNWERGL